VPQTASDAGASLRNRTALREPARAWARVLRLPQARCGLGRRRTAQLDDGQFQIAHRGDDLAIYGVFHLGLDRLKAGFDAGEVGARRRENQPTGGRQSGDAGGDGRQAGIDMARLNRN
jgi:hypothetical protein